VSCQLQYFSAQRRATVMLMNGRDLRVREYTPANEPPPTSASECCLPPTSENPPMACGVKNRYEAGSEVCMQAEKV
jgi:hypothetical protein